MDFRSLLLGLKQMGSGLHGLPGERGFDSHAVASRFRMPVKRASNDLRRLCRMGFLRKTRAKRSCLTRGGIFCIKGFEYRYCLSSQGMKYVKWLQGRRMIEDMAYEELTSEVLSHLPEELKDRLSMLSLAKAARRYKGPNRNMNLLDGNAVPVIHLSAEKTRLQSEKGRLEIENAIQKLKVTKLEGTINNYMEQNTILAILLAQAYVLEPKTRNPPRPGGNSSSRLSLCSPNSQGFLYLSPHSAETRETTRIPSTQPMTPMPHCSTHEPAYHTYQL